MAEAGQALARDVGRFPEPERRAAGSKGRLGAVMDEYLGRRAAHQLFLIVGLAAAIAAGLALFMWAQEPAFQPLYANLPQEDAAAVTQALEAAGIEYRLDGALVSVPAARLDEARLKLASQGLPGTGGVGFESLREDQGFGTSSFMENARYQRALETELARTVGSIQVIRAARVHLAIPKASVFLAQRREPSASVTVTLFPGRSLSDGQVQSIVNLVAGSVPDLGPERVTVVDQRGRLLSGGNPGESQGLEANARQLAFEHRLEASYVRRIEDLLEPMVGAGRIRAQVDARLDFSRQERTEELYDPERTALRSEQSSENRSQRPGAEGVPGALVNQPPGPGELDPQQAEGANGEPLNSSASATRNYEVSKTVRHVQGAPGGIQRLSVAVLLDQPTEVDDAGNVVPAPRTDAELAQIEALVREAVGFDAERGDSVQLTSAPFREQTAPEPQQTPLWQQPWLAEAGRLGLAALLGLVLLLAVVRPIVRSLTAREEPPPAAPAPADEQTAALSGGSGDTRALPGPGQQANPMAALAQKNAGYEERLDAARELVGQEPALAANVVKDWLSNEA